ncbi:hypothetical protein ACH4D5_22475 [Streptomyces sp. NPDC018029]|uniref:hypothetical protein n=1 Tax=Streptomyces sp. NPDC018029 TaxID=3365032 RepID=UPI00379EC15D
MCSAPIALMLADVIAKGDPRVTDDADRAPTVGEAVHDSGRDRVGHVMGHEGPYVQLRPLAGGQEWDAGPGRLRILTQSELLSALLAEVSARSRQPS